MSVLGNWQIRHLLVALLALPTLNLTFVLYQRGNLWIALALLAVTCLGVFIYLNPSAMTFRYLFPGFLGFTLFVILPLAYTVYIGFTKYSSQNLLSFDRSAALFRNETFVSANAASYKYKLYAQDDGNYILSLEDDKDPGRRFASEPFELAPGAKPKAESEPVKVSSLPGGQQVKGKPLSMVDINRGKLLSPLRGRQFALPDDILVGMGSLTNFTTRERLWTPNPDGSLTGKKDDAIIRPDFKQGFCVDQKGERVGVGFRTFSGFDNFTRILTDPRTQEPFFRIFLWTVTFSAISVTLTFSLGIPIFRKRSHRMEKSSERRDL